MSSHINREIERQLSDIRLIFSDRIEARKVSIAILNDVEKKITTVVKYMKMNNLDPDQDIRIASILQFVCIRKNWKISPPTNIMLYSWALRVSLKLDLGQTGWALYQTMSILVSDDVLARHIHLLKSEYQSAAKIIL